MAVLDRRHRIVAGKLREGDRAASRDGYQVVTKIEAPAGKGLDTIEVFFGNGKSEYMHVFDKIEVTF